jgi:hypothetical protein
MTVAAYTSFNKRYLPRALILASTLARHNPSVIRVAVMVDELTASERALIQTHFDRIILADELFPKDEFRPWMFGHDVVEACTAVKGRALTFLLEEGHEKVIYLDPDVALFSSLDRVIEGLDSSSVLLTPHQVQPEDSAGPLENERSGLRYGVFNLGFLAVKNDEKGLAVARWWNDRLWRFCIDDPANGLFTDQKWFDLAPCLFDGIGVLRDPGYNVASWNLNRRNISIRNEIMVNDVHRLVFFHFTKVRGIGDLMLQRNAIDWGPVKEVYLWYLRQLDGKELLCRGVEMQWAYHAYDNGQPIALEHRRLFRGDASLQRTFVDPFRV